MSTFVVCCINVVELMNCKILFLKSNLNSYKLHIVKSSYIMVHNHKVISQVSSR